MRSTLILTIVGPFSAYSVEILGIVSGLGAVATRDYSQGITDVFQSASIVFGTASVIGLRRLLQNVHIHVHDIHELLRES